MKIEGEAKLLRIFIGEADKINHVSVFEKIINEARKNNLAGATAYKGIMGFGGNSRIHSAKILRLSEDLPIVVEIVDEEKKIEEFIPFVEMLFKDAACGGLITIEKAVIIKYTPNKSM
jgi:PII-like signaling protein